MHADAHTPRSPCLQHCLACDTRILQLPPPVSGSTSQNYQPQRETTWDGTSRSHHHMHFVSGNIVSRAVLATQTELQACVATSVTLPAPMRFLR